ncbi:zinc-binding alcohol dehydrogenase family protein [Nocardia sp. NPDC005978]|uniref:zinc-binding alcohol dehydrogenase family protein n=1 Tax=Nocardia sp. NPDC005978 TaxID=3156725 RepID=UPI0033ABF953
MTSIPSRMPAVARRRALPVDDPDSLIDIDVAVPAPGPRDLLVRIEAVALNPVDYKIRASSGPTDDARILGWDAAGTVVAIGGQVEHFAVGDEVFYAGALDRPGSNAAYQAVDERLVAHKPTSLTFTESAALPLTSLTAWEGLFERLGLRVDAMEQTGTLLVTAAAGGVGAMVAQLARALTSLAIVGTASRAETAEFARRMGVDHVVDHRRELGPQLADIAPASLDYVFSTAGTDRNLSQYADALRPFGSIVAIDDFESLPIGVLKAKSLSFHWEFMFTRSMFGTPDQSRQRHILTQIARLVDLGTLTTTATRDLGPITAANLRAAHKLQESGTTIGKTTLTGFP